MKGLNLKIFKLFVLFGFPFFGFLYAYQFTGQDREIIVPFKPFRAPQSPVFEGGTRVSKRSIPLIRPITVVNFWATWCPPCVEEFPAMLELKRQLAAKGVEIVFVSVDEDWNNVIKFLGVNNVAYDPETMFWDPLKDAATQWGSSKFPETYVVRRDSWVVEKIIGMQAWTRPIVIQYFSNLAEKFNDIEPVWKSDANSPAKSWVFSILDRLISSAQAENLSAEPLIHEQDQKALDKLRKNIETATQNLQNAEAAEKEEERNLQEQKILLERKKQEFQDAEEDLEKINLKYKEVNALIQKAVESIKVEEKEKRKIEGQIQELQSKIVDLQKRLEQSKDELNQANKGLNTRVQAVETFEKAKGSSDEEAGQLKSKREKAKSLLEERRVEAVKAEKEISNRQKRLADIRTQTAKAKKVLDEQKKKFAEFEQMLKK